MQCFLEFCNFHRRIKVLQVNHCFHNNLCEPGSELAQGLAFLTSLTKFSTNHHFFLEKGLFIAMRRNIFIFMSPKYLGRG